MARPMCCTLHQWRWVAQACRAGKTGSPSNVGSKNARERDERIGIAGAAGIAAPKLSDGHPGERRAARAERETIGL